MTPRVIFAILAGVLLGSTVTLVVDAGEPPRCVTAGETSEPVIFEGETGP